MAWKLEVISQIVNNLLFRNVVTEPQDARRVTWHGAQSKELLSYNAHAIAIAIYDVP